MKKFWIILSLLVLLSIIPASAMASTPVFYCTYNTSATGDGSYDNPWSCADSTELSTVVGEVCKATSYGILYQIVPSGYYRHVIEDPNDAACGVTNTTFYYGYPPDTGISLPVPVVISLAVALGALLMGGGYLVYRKRTA
jgi:hypothetical protein